MPDSDFHHLRVLIANEKRDRLELLAQFMLGLGHDVIARETYVKPGQTPRSNLPSLVANSREESRRYAPPLTPRA